MPGWSGFSTQPRRPSATNPEVFRNEPNEHARRAADRHAAPCGEAAAEVAGQQTRDVLDYLRRKGAHGATDSEISRDLGIRLDSARARRCELRDQAHVVDSGHRRATDSGRPAIVWTLPAFAPAAVQAARPAGSGADAGSDDPSTTAAGCDSRSTPVGQDLPPLPPRAVATGTGEKCRCGSTAFVDVEISEGRTRRDCRACGRFMSFPKWYERATK